MSDWTEDEARDLAIALPGHVRETPSGPVPLITKDEMWAAMKRYPSAFKLPELVDAGQPDAALRARFPSMFPTRTTKPVK